MDEWLARHRASVQLRIALSAIHVGSELAREGKRLEISSQLSDLAEEVIYLHRQLLDLPAQRTPAACEFERAELDQEDVPF